MLTHIREFHKELTLATSGEGGEWGWCCSYAVCHDGDDTMEHCGSRQMETLQRWMERENLELDKAESFPSLLARSPLNYLQTMPTTMDSLAASHEYNKKGCGLAILEAKLDKDGKARLLQWAVEKGDEARPVMDEHIEYMAGQRKKNFWLTYTDFTI
jgi:hypothetical protein